MPWTSFLFRNAVNVMYSLVLAEFESHPLIPTANDPVPLAENFPAIPFGASPDALFGPLGISQSFY